MIDFLIRPENMPGRAATAFFTTRQVPDNMNVLASYAGVRPQNIYLPIQKHTDIVQIVDADDSPYIADAVVTHRPGLMIGVQTADCVPILLCDPQRRVVAAVHAGWRSTAAEILKKTLTVFSEHYYSSPADIHIAIGPAICGRCYEVGPEVIDGVTRATGAGDYSFAQGGKYHIDLRAANRQQALTMGIPSDLIWITPDCTHCLPEKYYSYRYAKGVAGRQYSCIALRD
jgi:hypothetical protein